MLTLFRNIVDNTSATFSSPDLNDAYVHLGLSRKNFISSGQIEKEIFARINDALTVKTEASRTSIDFNKLFKLFAELVYRHVLYDEDPTLAQVFPPRPCASETCARTCLQSSD